MIAESSVSVSRRIAMGARCLIMCVRATETRVERSPVGRISQAPPTSGGSTARRIAILSLPFVNSIGFIEGIPVTAGDIQVHHSMLNACTVLFLCEFAYLFLFDCMRDLLPCPQEEISHAIEQKK